MSIPQYEASQSPAPTRHDQPDQDSQSTGRTMLFLVSGAMVIVPAAFWGSIAWIVWGWLGAGVATIVVLVVSLFAIGLVRSGSEIETPQPARRPASLKQAA